MNKIIDAYTAGRFSEAFELCCEEIKDDFNKILLANISYNVGITNFSPVTKRALTECLKSPNVSHQKLFRVWKETFKLDPSMNFKIDWKSLQRPMFDPFFIEGLRTMIMADPDLEKLIKDISQFLGELPPGVLRNKHAPFIKALAENSVLNENVYDPPDIMIPNKGDKVQAMYEENPYPRWNTIDLQPQTYQESGTFLYAGCGTGRALLQAAYMFPNAKFKAIDLSLNSISYAKKKADEYSIHNIDFKQRDIMNLTGSYDVIECSGVLHHMEDPLAGWKKLTQCLAPGGRMFIGLYSSTARRIIIQAQKHIKERGLNIREAREEILNPESPLHSIASITDFYTLSGCRDLLFHPREKNYSIPEICEMLNGLDLRFLGFKFRSPALRKLNKTPLDLMSWHEIEQKNPNLFLGMYQFLCGKDEAPGKLPSIIGSFYGV